MLTKVADTSMGAYASLPVNMFKSQCSDIVAIITITGHPMTGQQIKAAYHTLRGVALDIGTISARVNHMVNKTFELERRAIKVECPISGIEVNPIGLPLKQLELV